MEQLCMIHEIVVSNVIQFVKEQKLEKEFQELTGVDIDKWEFDEPDQDIIDNLLKHVKHPNGTKIHCEYDDRCDNFNIMIFD